jgi:hypothetical protein
LRRPTLYLPASWAPFASPQCALLAAFALVPAARADLPPIKHVFVIVLENKNFDETYSLLRRLEDLFGLAHLGYAGQGRLRPFGSDVYDASPAPSSSTARQHHRRRHHRRKHRRHRHHHHRHR